MTMSHWKRIMNEDTHLLLIPKNKDAQKYQNFYLAAQMEHDQFSYFCRGLDDFCWGPAPVGPTLVTGPGKCRDRGGRLSGYHTSDPYSKPTTDLAAEITIICAVEQTTRIGLYRQTK